MVGGVNADETKAIGSAQVTPGLATGMLTLLQAAAAGMPAVGGRPAAGTPDQAYRGQER